MEGLLPRLLVWGQGASSAMQMDGFRPCLQMGSSGRQMECVEALMNVEISGQPVPMVTMYTA